MISTVYVVVKLQVQTAVEVNSEYIEHIVNESDYEFRSNHDAASITDTEILHISSECPI